VYPAIPDTQERSLGSRLSDAHAERCGASRQHDRGRGVAADAAEAGPAAGGPKFTRVCADRGRRTRQICSVAVHRAPVTLEEETRRYVVTLEQLAALGEPGTDTDAWNRAVEANQSSYLVLRQSREGRGAIERLIDHPATTVRGGAAAHALLWNEERARPVLAALAEDEGLEGLSARQTLHAFDAGTLSHEW
jgi:hypothetical protein